MNVPTHARSSRLDASEWTGRRVLVTGTSGRRRGRDFADRPLGLFRKPESGDAAEALSSPSALSSGDHRV
jgi:hypothetical protein